MNTWITANWSRLAAILLIAGVLVAPLSNITLPFAYFQLMNWVVVVASLVTVWQAYTQNNTFFVALFGLIAIVFNPIAPFYLRSDLWQIADVAVLLLFVLALFTVRSVTVQPKIAIPAAVRKV